MRRIAFVLVVVIACLAGGLAVAPISERGNDAAETHCAMEVVAGGAASGVPPICFANEAELDEAAGIARPGSDR